MAEGASTWGTWGIEIILAHYSGRPWQRLKLSLGFSQTVLPSYPLQRLPVANIILINLQYILTYTLRTSVKIDFSFNFTLLTLLVVEYSLHNSRYQLSLIPNMSIWVIVWRCPLLQVQGIDYIVRWTVNGWIESYTTHLLQSINRCRNRTVWTAFKNAHRFLQFASVRAFSYMVCKSSCEKVEKCQWNKPTCSF